MCVPSGHVQDGVGESLTMPLYTVVPIHLHIESKSCTILLQIIFFYFSFIDHLGHCISSLN